MFFTTVLLTFAIRFPVLLYMRVISSFSTFKLLPREVVPRLDKLTVVVGLRVPGNGIADWWSR